MSQWLTFKPGEIRRKAQQYSLLTESVFDSEANGLRDIQVITTKEFIRERYYDAMWALGKVPNKEKVDEDIKDSDDLEFVSIENNTIVVGVNAEEVNDAAVDHALVLLTRIDDLTKEQFTTFDNAY